MSDFHDPGLDAIMRSDRFVDALASGARMSPVDPLSAMLGNWRDDVRSRPDAHVVTLEQASAALAKSQKPPRRNRFTLTVVGAAAAAVLSIGGFVAVVSDARPGDALYGLRTMLFGESTQTRNDAVSLASQQLAEVQQLVQQGQWDQAQERLVALAPEVQGLNNDPSKQQLVEQYNSLTAKVIQRDPEATAPAPGAPPPPVNQSSPLTFLPVPVITETTSPSSIPDLATTSGPSTTVPTPTTPLPTPTSTGPLPTSNGPLPTTTGPQPPPTTPQPTPQPSATTPQPSPTAQQPSPTPTTPPTILRTTVPTATATATAPVTVTTPPVRSPVNETAPTTVAKSTVASPPPTQQEQPKPEQTKPETTKPETPRGNTPAVITTPTPEPEGPAR